MKKQRQKMKFFHYLVPTKGQYQKNSNSKLPQFVVFNFFLVKSLGQKTGFSTNCINLGLLLKFSVLQFLHLNLFPELQEYRTLKSTQFKLPIIIVLYFNSVLKKSLINMHNS